MTTKFVFYGAPESGRMLFLAEAKLRFPESICLDLKATSQEQQLDLVTLIGQGSFPIPVFLSAGPIPLSEFTKFNFQVIRIQHTTWEAYMKHLKFPHRYNLQTLDEYLRSYDVTSGIPDDVFSKTFESDALFGPDKDQFLAECWDQFLPQGVTV